MQKELVSGEVERSEARAMLELFGFVRHEDARVDAYSKQVALTEHSIPELGRRISKIEGANQSDGLYEIAVAVADFLGVQSTKAGSRSQWHCGNHILFGSSQRFPAITVGITSPLYSFRNRDDHFVATGSLQVENANDRLKLEEIGTKYGLGFSSSHGSHIQEPILGGLVINLINVTRAKFGYEPLMDTTPIQYMRDQYRFCARPQDLCEFIGTPEHASHLLDWVRETTRNMQAAFSEFAEYKVAHPHSDWIPGISKEMQRGAVIRFVEPLAKK